MTDPQTPPTDTSPANDAPASPPPAPEAPSAASHEPTSPTTTTSSAASAEGAENEEHGDEGDDGEDAGDAGDAGEGGASAEGATTEGGAPKKRRRRRRKKKAAGPEGAEGAVASPDGTPVEGAAPGEGAAAPAGGGRHQQPRQPKPKREHRPDRERPAFNVGDVVFGKVTEVTEDALFVDLSGKARAIFDLRELTITEDDVEEYTKADRREADEIAAARAATAAAAAANPTAASAPPAGHEDTAAETTEVSAVDDVEPAAGVHAAASLPVADDGSGAATGELTTEAAPAAEASAEAAPAVEGEAAHEDASPEGEAAPEGEAEAVPGGEAAPEGTTPTLPHVIMEPGAPFVGLVHNDGGRGGLVVLTHHPKRVQKTKPVIAEASRSGSLIFGLVTGTIKGGVEVDVDGLRAFAPASHVELRPGSDLSHLVGKRLTFAVTQYAKRGRDVVLSRRAMLENEAQEKRSEALKHIEIGSTVDGVVRTVVPFGAFVDVGGVEGLVPLSEMSHNRADQPKDVFKVGETVKVKILRLDERGKLWLSRRAATDDPWSAVAQKYAPGTKHMGKVVRLQPFGAFIELETGIDGLIHSADLSVKRIEHPEEVVKVGDELEVVVASNDSQQHRIALHPAPTGEAANEEPQKIGPNKIVKVVIVSVETGGLTVRVMGATGRNARGFISGMSTGTPRGTELRKLFPVGKQLDAKIIELDPRRGELKLSIKAMNEESERNAYQQYRAQVKREAKFGTFADLLAKRNEPTK